MQFYEVYVKLHPGTLTSDRCARSGLNDRRSGQEGGDEPITFSTIYTTNFTEMADFYRKLLGEENLRINGDGMLVFGNSRGSVVIKRVRDESQFAKLVGRQSLGMVGMAPNLIGFASNSVGDQLEWDTNVTQIKDPDGNVVLFAAPECAEVIPIRAVNR